jgi:hypothetical protein
MRVEKLLAEARTMAKTRRQEVRSRRCADATWEELLQMVDEALFPESYPVVEDILKQMEEYHQRPPRELPNGKLKKDIHGFVEWLWGLQDGWAALPETIPHAVLLAWRNGYANHPAQSTPIPHCRCEDCHMVLPNCTADGFGLYINPCPVCGSDRIGFMNLWAWGTFSLPRRSPRAGH